MCATPRRQGADDKAVHEEDFHSGDQRDLLIMMRQNHDELIKQFGSLREEVLQIKYAMAEHGSLARSGRSQPEVEPGMFAVSMAKPESRKNNEPTRKVTEGVFEVNDGVKIPPGSSRVTLQSANQTSEVTQRQPSKESTFSSLNIYDPADSIRDGESELTTSKTMVQMTHESVRAWKLRIDGQGFDLFMGLVILANAFVMSIQLEYEGTIAASSLGLSADTNHWPRAKSAFFVLQHLFTIIFVFEIIARVCMWGLQYYRSAVRFLDLGIVMISVVDLYVLQGFGVSLPNVTFLRLLRLVKLARVLRMVRVFSVFRHLRVLIHSIISSIGALMWSMVFLALVHLITSILITQSLQSWLNDPANDLDTRMFVYDRFGTFFRSCITLFEMTFAIGTWGRVGRVVIFSVSRWYALFFLGYLTLVSFAVIRVISAIFLKETLAASSKDADTLMAQENRDPAYVQKIRSVFNDMDLHSTGTLSLEDIEASVQDKDICRRLIELNIDIHEVKGLFTCTDSAAVSKQLFFLSQSRRHLSIHVVCCRTYKQPFFSGPVSTC